MLVRILDRRSSGNPVPAVFVDRDGVLNRRIRDGYVLDPAELVVLDGVVPALVEATSAGWPVVIISNQGCISRGLLPEAGLDAIHQRLLDHLSGAGVRISAIYVCPHHPAAADPAHRSCSCRKPQPGMILGAAGDLGLDLGRSVFIGDQDSDRRAAAAAGITGNRFFLVDGATLPEKEAADLRRSLRRLLGAEKSAEPEGIGSPTAE